MKATRKMAFLSFFVILLLSYSCSDHTNYRETNGVVWNTTYRIIYNSSKDLNDSILNTLNVVGKSLSVFDSTSIVSNINNNKSYSTDIHFRRVFERAKQINKLSYGAFDPTIAPLINAWGFGYKNAFPDTIHIDSILQYVGINKCFIHKDSLIKNDSRITFNFSAIAKGYGCDMVAEMFIRNSVSDFIIEIGGEVVAHGNSPRGGKWNIAIEHPDYTQNRSAQLIISLSGSAMATSGNYRNYRNENGHRIAHTINPATGRPQQSDIVSATIVSEKCMDADAYATACMVLGSQKAKMMIHEQNLAAFLIFENDSTWASPKFRTLLNH